MKLFLFASILLAFCVYDSAAFSLLCPSVTPKEGANRLYLIGGDVTFSLERVYVDILGGFLSNFLNIQIDCPKFRKIFGGKTSVNLGNFGKVEYDENGQAKTKSSSFLSTALFTAGPDDDFQVATVCVSVFVNVVVIYRNDNSKANIDVALNELKDLGVDVSKRNPICDSARPPPPTQ